MHPSPFQIKLILETTACNVVSSSTEFKIVGPPTRYHASTEIFFTSCKDAVKSVKCCSAPLPLIQSHLYKHYNTPDNH